MLQKKICYPMTQVLGSITSCGTSIPISSTAHTNEWWSSQKKKYTNNANKARV